MNVFCCRWLVTLLMVVTGASVAGPVIPRTLETSPMPLLPPDTRCSLSVSNPVVDYGVMSRWQLEDMGGGRVSPGKRSLMVNIVCPYSRPMKLRVEGERNEQQGFRYGERSVTRLRLMDAQLDGNPVEMRAVMPGGIFTDNEKHALTLNAGQQLAPVIQGRLAKGKMLTARLEIQPLLVEADARVSSRQRSETLLTLTLDD